MAVLKTYDDRLDQAASSRILAAVSTVLIVFVAITISLAERLRRVAVRA
jgi:hypothetical protein